MQSVSTEDSIAIVNHMMIQELQHPEEMLSMQKMNQHSHVYYSMTDSSQRMRGNQYVSG